MSITSGKENITGQDSNYASVVYNDITSEVIVKLVNEGDKPYDITIQLNVLKHITNKTPD